MQPWRKASGAAVLAAVATAALAVLPPACVDAIVIWHPMGSALTWAIGNFTAANPEFSDVVVEEHGWATLFNDIQAVRAGNASFNKPDVLMYGSTWSGQFIRQGILTPLSDYFAAWRTERAEGDITRDITRGPEFDYVYQKQWYALPFNLDVRVLYYRADMYQEALNTTEPPQNWHEVLNNSLAIQQHYKTKFNLDIQGFPLDSDPQNQQTLQAFVPFYLSYGASPVTSDGHCNMRTAEFRSALEMFTDFYFEGANPYNNLYLSDTFMGQGQWAHFLGGSWQYWNLNDTVRNQTEVAVMPGGPMGRYAFLGGSATAIPTWSPNKDRAWEFIKTAFDPAKPVYQSLIGSMNMMPAFDSQISLVNNEKTIQGVAKNVRYASVQQYPLIDFLDFSNIETNGTISRLMYRIQALNYSMHDAIELACAEIEEVLHPPLQCSPACAGPAFSGGAAEQACMPTDATNPFAPGTCVNVDYIHHTGGSIVMQVIAGLAMLGIFGCGIIFWLFRKTDVIRAASPVFCEFMVVGMLLMFAYVFAISGQPTKTSCSAEIWLLPIGVGLVFGNLIAKTYRIHRIFNNKAMRVVALQDMHLLPISGTVLGIEVLLAAIWQGMSVPVPTLVASGAGSSASAMLVCKSPNAYVQSTMTATLLIFNAVLLIVTAYYAIQTRSAANKYRESVLIAFSVNNAMLSCIAVFPVIYLATVNLTTLYYFKAIGIIYAVGFMAACLIGYKLVHLRQQMDQAAGTTVLKSMQSGDSGGNPKSPTMVHAGSGSPGPMRRATGGSGSQSMGDGALVMQQTTLAYTSVCVLNASRMMAKWHNKQLAILPAAGIVAILGAHEDSDQEGSFATYADDVSVQNVSKQKVGGQVMPQFDLLVRSQRRSYTVQFHSVDEMQQWIQTIDQAQRRNSAPKPSSVAN